MPSRRVAGIIASNPAFGNVEEVLARLGGTITYETIG